MGIGFSVRTVRERPEIGDQRSGSTVSGTCSQIRTAWRSDGRVFCYSLEGRKRFGTAFAVPTIRYVKCTIVRSSGTSRGCQAVLTVANVLPIATNTVGHQNILNNNNTYFIHLKLLDIKWLYIKKIDLNNIYKVIS